MPYDPSALSDEEAASDVELDVRSTTSSNKKQSRDKKPAKYTMDEPEDFDDEEQNGDAAEDGAEDDEEGDVEEDVYVVEKILDHMLNDDVGCVVASNLYPYAVLTRQYRMSHFSWSSGRVTRKSLIRHGNPRTL